MIDCKQRGHGSTHGQDASRVSVQRRQQIIGSVAGRLQRAWRPACSRLQMSAGTPNACHAAGHRRGEPGDPAESGHTRGSEVARYARAAPLPSPSAPLAVRSRLPTCCRVVSAVQRYFSTSATSLPCAAQSNQRVRAATTHGTCPSRQCSRDGPAASRTPWTR